MDGLHLTDLPLATKSVSQSSLPLEIRLQIWNELLQDQPEAMGLFYARFIHPSLFTSHLGDTSFFSLDGPREDRVQPHILRVCRLVHEEATPIFYSNMVVISIPSGIAYHPDALSAYNRFIECVRRPRPVNIRKIFFIVYAGNDFMLRDDVIRRDAPLIQAACEALSNVASYERIWIELVDSTIHEAFGRSRDRALSLLRGFGILHCQKPNLDMVLTKTAESLEWAMRRPGPMVPLWLLHRDLVAYLHKYDPDDTFNGRNWTLKEFLITQSERAANDLDAGCFFLNWDLVIDYVLEVLRQGLTGAIAGLDWVEDNIVRRAREEGDKMKLLRDSS